MITRHAGRALDALRPITVETGFQKHAAGSALIRWGDTHVLCAVTMEERVPPHRAQSGGGWLTAEYNMLPASTDRRIRRDRARKAGRTQEIQRLIGRSLRAAVDLDTLGQRTYTIDCDVLQADGGTRCASITGAWIALALARAAEGRTLRALPPPVAAVSLGIKNGVILTDLDYPEDSTADVDLNFVGTETGIIEVQGTAEGRPFTAGQLAEMVDRGRKSCAQLFEIQRATLLAAGVQP